jgi:hypothetical protein
VVVDQVVQAMGTNLPAEERAATPKQDTVGAQRVDLLGREPAQEEGAQRTTHAVTQEHVERVVDVLHEPPTHVSKHVSRVHAEANVNARLRGVPSGEVARLDVHQRPGNER